MPATVPRVLIVDDDSAIRKLLAVLCGRLGFNCDSASDGVEALQKIEDESFDLMLLDLMMPRLNGFQVIDRLRHRTERPRIVVVTAQGQKQTAELESEPMVEAVITKPFEMDVLCEVLSKVTSGLGKPVMQRLGATPPRATED
jgi:CheY-like chemotaxis protein